MILKDSEISFARVKGIESSSFVSPKAQFLYKFQR